MLSTKAGKKETTNTNANSSCSIRRDRQLRRLHYHNKPRKIPLFWNIQQRRAMQRSTKNKEKTIALESWLNSKITSHHKTKTITITITITKTNAIMPAKRRNLLRWARSGVAWLSVAHLSASWVYMACLSSRFLMLCKKTKYIQMQKYVCVCLADNLKTFARSWSCRLISWGVS